MKNIKYRIKRRYIIHTSVWIGLLGCCFDDSGKVLHLNREDSSLYLLGYSQSNLLAFLFMQYFSCYSKYSSKSSWIFSCHYDPNFVFSLLKFPQGIGFS